MMDIQELFEESRPVTLEVSREFCRQEQLASERSQELDEAALAELQKNDHALLRDYRGTIPLEAYIEATLLPFLEKLECERGKQILEANLALVQNVCRSVARASRLPDEGAEDLIQTVCLRLCRDGYRALRSFRGTSLKAYLRRIAKNTFLDRFLRPERGRFRPSEAAKRLGLAARMLEELIYGRGYSDSEAVTRVGQQDWCRQSPEELEQLIPALPVRERPRQVSPSPEELRLAAPDSSNAREESWLKVLRQRVYEGLQIGIRGLTPEERILLRAVFLDDLSIAEYSRLLHLEQRPLYRLQHSALRSLRECLRGCGLDWETVRRLLSWDGLDLGFAEEEE